MAERYVCSRVGVLYWPGSEATLADNHQGTKFNALVNVVMPLEKKW